jgi:prepilin-type N-terminal cleavage/methylation domain-containing protein
MMLIFIKMKLKIFSINFSNSQNISKNNGFTLVEVMVVMGIMGIVALGTSSMFTNMSRQNAKQNAENDLQNLVNTVYGVLGNQSVCTAAFSGKSYNSDSLPNGVDGGLSFAGVTIAPGTKWGNITINSLNWINPDTTLGSSSIMVGSTPITLTSHLVTLQIDAKINITSHSSSSFLRKINFIVGVDPSHSIKSCFTSIDSNAVCTQLGGVNVAGRCMMTLPINNTLSQGSTCSPNGISYYSDHVGMFICSQGKYEFIKIYTMCESLGGTPITIATTGQKICRFIGSSCLGVSTPVDHWSSTVSSHCCGGSTSGCNDGNCCNTLSHNWANQATETCFADRVVACGPATSGGNRCSAKITNIGCTMP